jgi:glycosyltransferase involved in cell wall biosynthesis
MSQKPRLLRITTVPVSLTVLLKGQLNFFQDHGFEVLTISAAGPEVEELKKLGIAHHSVPMTRQITPLRDLICLVQLIVRILKFKPDIVHTHTPKAGLLGMMAARIAGVKVRMHTVAGLPLMEANGLKRSILVQVEKLTYACATQVYPNSAGLLHYIQQHITAKPPMSIIGRGSSNGINSSLFSRTPELELKSLEIRKQYGIHESDIVFSFVGRIVRDKGIGELVEAFRKLTDQRVIPDHRVYLLLVGNFEQELNALRKADFDFLHTCDRVILAGFQPDVRPWIIASDVFVFPSYREGFPNVVMQAACLEVPCIVSDINGSNEIITNDERGIIVRPKNAEDVCNAMSKLAADVSARRNFSMAARNYVVGNFDQKYVWGELKKEYEKQLNR